MPKYYIVPAEVYESNFPEDYEQAVANGEVAVFETSVDMDLATIAKGLEG